MAYAMGYRMSPLNGLRKFRFPHSPNFSPARGQQCWKAPKGRDITAQANGLGFKDQVIRQALKGRPNTRRNAFSDNRFTPGAGAGP